MLQKTFEMLVQQDYEERLSRIELQTGRGIKELLLIQSIKGDIEGNSRNFHLPKNKGKNRKKRKKRRRFLLNRTMDDVVCALGYKPEEIKQEMQEYTDELERFGERVMSGDPVESYANGEGEPLFRIPFLGNIESRAGLLIGMYLGFAMDSTYWRTETAKRYGVQIGTNMLMGINRSKLREERISLYRMLKSVHSKGKIRELMERGVLCVNVETGRDIISENIFTGIGKGVCDDAAIIHAGLKYGIDAAKGVFLVDAGDTWSQYLPFVHGEKLGDRIGRKIEEAAKQGKDKDFALPAADEITGFILGILKKGYLAMSSSQVYLLKRDDRTRKCALECYFDYLRGDWGEDVHLGCSKGWMSTHGLFRHIEKSRS